MPSHDIIPEGFCQCGCGQRTRVALQDRPEFGHVKGKPLRYLLAHNIKRTDPPYILDPETGCWIWQRCLNEHGYGIAYRGGNTILAHRVYYRELKGNLHRGEQLDHLCRNRACVNPEHLEIVTPATNTQRGLKAKLTTSDVLKIRALGDTVSRKELAARFGVGTVTVHNILHRKTWRNL